MRVMLAQPSLLEEIPSGVVALHSHIISMAELVQKYASVCLSFSKGKESEMFRLCDSGKLLLELLMQKSVEDSSSSHMLIQFLRLHTNPSASESGRFWQRRWASICSRWQ
eukprot:6081187-Amphidinium_carterae.2